MKSAPLDKSIAMVNNFDMHSDRYKEKKQFNNKVNGNNNNNNILIEVFCRIFSQL